LPVPPGSAKELERRWSQLRTGEAGLAWRALAALARSRGLAPLLANKVRPVAPAVLSRIDRLIAQLDDDDFATRQRAEQDLRKVGLTAEASLRRALANKSSPERRWRATRLLKALQSHLSRQRLEQGRVLELLEQVGSPEARKVLKALAARAPTEWQRTEATEALQRLARRASAKR
jgi:hypothetical protein